MDRNKEVLFSRALAVDAVVYHLKGLDVNHFEVELEVKGRGGLESVNIMATMLQEMFGRELREWRYSKLVTGRTIENLMTKGVLKNLLEANGDLKPEAYDRIMEFLDEGARPG